MTARLVLVLVAVAAFLWDLEGSAVASCHGGGIRYSSGAGAVSCGTVAAVASGVTANLAAAGALVGIAVSTVLAKVGKGGTAVPEAGAAGSGAGSGGGGHPRREATPVAAMPTASDPVHLATGEMVHPQTDVWLQGALELVLRRTHRSSYRSGRLFGPSWASTLDQRLEVTEHGVEFLTEDGMRLRYPAGHAGGPMLPVAGPRWPLSRDGQGGCTVLQPELGLELRFAPGTTGHPLAAVADRAGHRIEVRRNARGVPTDVVHSGGYRVSVRSESGLVTELALEGQGGTPRTVLVRYGYDPQRRLRDVVDSSDAPMRFGYDPQGRITHWQDRNGQWFGYVYDDQSRVIRTEGSANALTGWFEYGEQCTVFTDSLGRSTTYRFNGAGQLVRETDPLGNITVTEWDPYDRPLAYTDPLGRTTTCGYDAVGRVESGPDRRVHERSKGVQPFLGVLGVGALKGACRHCPARTARWRAPDGPR